MKSDYRKMIDEMLSKIKSEKKLKKIFEYTQAIKNHKALVAILKFIKLMYKNTAVLHGKM